MKVTTVDLVGNYAGGMSTDSAPKDNKSIYRLRGAVIETPKGSYFVKLTGPQKLWLVGNRPTTTTSSRLSLSDCLQPTPNQSSSTTEFADSVTGSSSFS